MTKGTILTILCTIWMIVVLGILYRIYFEKPKLINNLKQSQQHLDSTKSYYNVKLDSINTINVVLNSKIDAKNEVIRTLKGLVNDNNKKYQVITDSALVVELERLRINGIK